MTATGAYGTQPYTYNPIGNLLSKAGVTYTYPVLGQAPTAQTCNRVMPHAVTATSDGKGYGYDCNGNLVSDGERTVSWDAADRPISVTRTGIGATTFAYDGDGARVKKVGPAKTIRYLGSFEDHVTDTATVKHIFAGPLRVATRVVGPGPNAGTYFVHGDHLESLNVLTNGASDEVQRLSYQPFGTTQSHTGSVDFDFYRFTGQELDPETGLYDYGARYYHADLGRFVSADSLVPDLFDPQSLNRYSYALNNPVRLVDPTGSASSDPCPGGLCIKGSADGGSSSSPFSGDGEGGSPKDFVHAIEDFFHKVGDLFDSLFGGDDEPPPPPLPPSVAGSFGGQILPGDQFTGSGAVGDTLDGLQFALGAVGMVPVVGEPFDAVDAAISALRGDWTGAALSLGSIIPGPGNALGAVKSARRIIGPGGVANASGIIRSFGGRSLGSQRMVARGPRFDNLSAAFHKCDDARSRSGARLEAA